MIIAVLGAVFVIACLIALATFLLEGTAWAALIAVKLFMLLGRIIIAGAVMIFGSIGWMIWFCIRPSAARASLRKAQAEHKARAHG